jgi:hypothetical protein
VIVETQVLRPPKIFSWIALPFMLLYTYAIITDSILTTKNIIVCIVGWLLVAGAFAINRSSIVLDNEGITYKMFRGEKFIAYRDIAFADLVTHYHGHGYGVMWHIRISGGKEQQLTPLGKRNMKKMAEALTIKLAPSCLGERVIKLAEGKRVMFF